VISCIRGTEELKDMFFKRICWWWRPLLVDVAGCSAIPDEKKVHKFGNDLSQRFYIPVDKKKIVTFLVVSP